MDLILRGGRVIDPASGLDATRDVGFAGGRVAAVEPRIAAKAAREQDVSGAIVTPGHDRPAHPRLLGRNVDRRRRRADRPAQRHDDVRRRRHRRARQLSRLPAACDRAVAGAHPCVPQRVVRRHLRVQQDGDGRGGVRHSAARPERMRAGRARESRPDRGHQGARGTRRRRHQRRRAARHGARGRRRARPAGDGAHRPSAAQPQGSARAPAPRRRADPLLPAVSQLAAALGRRACAKRRCSRASAA